ncbi:hypothetical protein IGJ39_002775 [Enterococcus sp. AZ140]|uniref:hypothetical protein n=1 Tax=Enterococcus sp. AZ140 TaxID=2774731 RepID=UPI003F29AEA4
MNSSYHKVLTKKVIEQSKSSMWKEAVLEWEIEDIIEIVTEEASCICGKENIRYLYTIKNNKNSNILFPIGSSCIKKFDREDFNSIVSTQEKLFKLLHAVRDSKFITLDSEYFSRNLLEYLYEENVFTPNEFNNCDGENDYNFMLKMFNQRKDPSNKQQKKITAIILNSIKPFIEERLNNKIIFDT